MNIPPVPFLAKTKVSWTGEQEGDLGFLENEVINVFHLVDEMWWQGSLLRNGAEGIFPKDFVDVVPTSASAQNTPTKDVFARSGRSPQASPTPAKFTQSMTAISPMAQIGKNVSPKNVSPQHAKDYRSWGTSTKGKRAMHMSRSSPALHEYCDSGSHSKRSPQLYSQHVLSSGLTKAHSQEQLPSDYQLQEIAQKKQELEAQLNQLRQLEKSVHKSCSGESSFVSDVFSSRQEAKNEHTEDEGPPPPPKHKRAPFDADDFKASGTTMDEALRSSARYPEELKASIKSLQSDVLNLSELSATSAGSFLRHKFERQVLDDVDEGEPEKGSLEERFSKMLGESAADTVFEKKSKHPGIFKMLIKKKPENLMEQRLQQPDDWAVKVDVNRMNTLTSSDKQQRTKAVARSEASFIVKPLDYVSEINADETFGPDELEFGELKVNAHKVAQFSARYAVDSDFNDLISDISVKFGAWRPDQVRAVLMHLCKFRVVEEPERISQSKPKLDELMRTGEATIFQLNYLFKKLLEALRIPAEVVVGFWKKPNEFYHSDQFSVNHCWLSVMVETDARGNGCFRLVDLLCFQNGPICNIEGTNDFYFLSRPTDLLSTHIPSVVELQHVCPPVDLAVCFHLPRMYSSFRKSGLRLVNFNNSLTRMRDMEFFEADVVLPPDTELFTLIKTARKTSNDYTLCQVYWKGAQRMAKIKAVLPERESIGVLQVFSGPRGTQTHFDNIHELACVVPLCHSGKNKEFTFVPRYPTIRSQNNDLYIRHPQSSTLSAGNTYSFEVDAHPAAGLSSGSALMNRDFKLVVESPAGKYTKLVKEEPHTPAGTYASKLFCQEKGVYRGLVIGDSGNSWYVFAQWECV